MSRRAFYRRAFKAYQKVKALKPNRSVFDLSHSVLMTGDMGKCYPVFIAEMSPGDTFHIWMENVIRMQPLNAPVLHEISDYNHFFFVPYRILWDEWTSFITGESEDGESVSPALPRWNPSDTSVGSLWDYCGFPTGVTPNGALPLDFVRRCYNRIWNEYYRDENLQEEVSEDNEQILYRNWRKDYFTSALLQQQKGISPSLPVSGIGLNRVITSSNNFNDYATDGNRTYVFTHTYSIGGDFAFTEQVALSCNCVITRNGVFTSVSPEFQSFDSVNRTVTFKITVVTSSVGDSSRYITSTVNLNYVSMSEANSVNVKDLRVAFQIQKWLELANRGGTRYTEFLRSFFGVSPRDDRLQRPEYIGGTCSPIIISEVLQTSATSNEPTPQGNMAGHGVGASRTYVGSYTATEFGIVMGIKSIMPVAKYMQGINKQWLRRTKYDFLFPQFTGLSEQGIEEAEIYASDTEQENRRIFGFNEIYDELRSIPSRIVGKMRTVFDYWHLGRKFSSAPALNSDFIQCKPSKRIFAAPSEDGFIIEVGNLVRAVRPLPKYGTPKGV